MTVTDEEFAEIEDLTYPAFATVGLTNDYFSFDREFAEREGTPTGSEKEPMTNAVWLCMQWSSLDIAQAKELVRAKAICYEGEFAL